MPTNAEKSLRTAVRFLSSRFASSVSLASCCSLGKLIKRSNAFSFSLRLRSAFAHDVDYLLSTERKRTAEARAAEFLQRGRSIQLRRPLPLILYAHGREDREVRMVFKQLRGGLVFTLGTSLIIKIVCRITTNVCKLSFALPKI